MHTQFEWAWQKSDLSRHLKMPSKTVKTTNKKGTITKTKIQQGEALFPAHTFRSRPRTKVAVLQRMIVSPPWDRFDLEVQIFSEEALKWWNEGKEGKFPGGPHDPTRRQKGTVLAKAVENQKSIGLPDLSRVNVNVRTEGVDGSRLERERTGLSQGHETEEGSGTICVDDFDFAHAHWERWQDLAKHKSHRCAVCEKSVDTEVRSFHHLCFCRSLTPL